ncbi:hypothetical protein BKA66DRAFT_573672 [Pyrenochaeta sp. MPI-SDFR-AT-0127]|nr:hypothetical protein BKA66DRAFT_573672 [Pyrenochaeta sp. MPI-SDFR-AT-0127]
MGNYSGLPTELKIQISSYLPCFDLANLACVCKSHTIIAREHLYQAPEILQPDEGHRLIALLRTLFTQPHLIHKIRSLSISVIDCSVPFNAESSVDEMKECFIDQDEHDDTRWCPEYQAVQRELLHRLSEYGATAHSDLPWVQNIHNWRTTSFYSGLLVLLPNLVCISSSCYIKPVGRDCSVSVDESIDYPRRVFGRSPFDDLDLKVRQQLKLKEFRLKAGVLNRGIIQIPGVHHLALGSQAAVGAYRIDDFRHITHLEVSISFTAVNTLTWHYIHIRTLLSTTSKLKQLKLKVEAPSDSALCAAKELLFKRFLMILDDLDLSMSTLETLVIISAEQRQIELFRSLDPLPDFRKFINLRKLTLPFQPSVDSLENKLPPNIEELDLHLLCTSPIISSPLDSIVRYKIANLTLRRLNLYILHESNFVIGESIWERLKENKVATYVWVREHTLIYAMPA